MSIHATAIDVRTFPGDINGQLTLHDDTTGRDVRIRVRPDEAPPGYVFISGSDGDLPEDWPAFVVEADRIMNSLLITADEAADRYRAASSVVWSPTGNRVDDPEFDHLVWRFIRGEFTIAELEGEVERLNAAPPSTPAEPTDRAGIGAAVHGTIHEDFDLVTIGTSRTAGAGGLLWRETREDVLRPDQLLVPLDERGTAVVVPRWEANEVPAGWSFVAADVEPERLTRFRARFMFRRDEDARFVAVWASWSNEHSRLVAQATRHDTGEPLEPELAADASQLEKEVLARAVRFVELQTLAGTDVGRPNVLAAMLSAIDVEPGKVLR